MNLPSGILVPGPRSATSFLDACPCTCFPEICFAGTSFLESPCETRMHRPGMWSTLKSATPVYVYCRDWQRWVRKLKGGKPWFTFDDLSSFSSASDAASVGCFSFYYQIIEFQSAKSKPNSPPCTIVHGNRVWSNAENSCRLREKQ